ENDTMQRISRSESQSSIYQFFTDYYTKKIPPDRLEEYYSSPLVPEIIKTRIKKALEPQT
ncbi:MAG: hypothetical protein AB7H97_17190, partial [Pseudobdellovibrionaceae bacterium]